MTHLSDYATDTDGPSSKVILTGAIGDYGSATYVHPDGSPDPEHTGLLELSLSHGAFRLNLAALHERIVEGFAHFPVNGTCSGTVDASAPAPIVAGSGTGSYVRARGSFNLTATIDEVDERAATKPCDAAATFLSQLILVAGYATVRLD